MTTHGNGPRKGRPIETTGKRADSVQRKGSVRQAWRKVLMLSDLPTPTKLLGCVFADFSETDEDDGIDVSLAQARLAEYGSMASNSVTKHRQRLIERGWLVEVEPAQGRRAALYRLTLPPRSPSLEAGAVRRTRGVS